MYDMFNLFSILFPLVFLLILGMFLVTFIRGLGTWHKNNQAPRLTVAVEIVAKRTNVSHHTHSGGPDSMGHTSTSTTYYVTFQVESGDRMELSVPGSEYGLMVEGDRGTLLFQGTRFLSFSRGVPDNYSQQMN